jgi:hypothetical protein
MGDPIYIPFHLFRGSEGVLSGRNWLAKEGSFGRFQVSGPGASLRGAERSR